MKDNFDLRKFLSENKLTSNSKMLKEESESFKYEIIDPSQDANSLDRILDAIKLLNKKGIELTPQDKTGHYSGGYNDVNSVFVSSKLPYNQLIRKVNDILFGTEFEKLRIMEVISEDEDYDVTQDVEVGMRVIDAENDLFEVIEVTPTRITLEPVGYEGENVYFPEDFGKDVNIEDFWFHLEEQEEERTGMFGEPYDSDEWGSGPF